MPGEDIPQPSAPAEALGPRAPWASRVMDRAEEFTRRILAPLRPRVSLASGSVLVLLTLFLPIGYNSCGPETKGYELLQGKGDWPTLVGITLSDYFGPAFYGALLALAGGTALISLLAMKNPSLLGNPSRSRRLFMISGALSLFLVSDFAALLPLAADDIGALAAGLIVLTCLLPGKFWPKRIFWRWFGAVALALLILFGLTALKWIQGDVPAWFVLGIWAIYALTPLGLWLAGVSGKLAAEWYDIRRGLAAFYFPAVVGNLWFFVVVWGEGLWGFIPCSIGAHLMALGYMHLSKEGAPTQESPPVGSGSV